MPGRRRDIEVLAMSCFMVQVYSFHIISLRGSTTLNTPVPHGVKYPRQAQQLKYVRKAPKLLPRELDRILRI
jgi:hypothetical protein